MQYKSRRLSPEPIAFYYIPYGWCSPHKCLLPHVIEPSISINFKFNTLRPRQNGRHFADDTFKCIFLNENARIFIKISLKFVPKGPINNIPALVQIMAWRRSGDKPLSEPMMVSLLTHICVTRPQWVKMFNYSLSLMLWFQKDLVYWKHISSLICSSYVSATSNTHHLK